MKRVFHTKSTSRVGRSGSFTLIELLVVVAIVAVLVAILLPALTAARQQGRWAVCLSQCREWGTCFELYLSDNAGVVPYGDPASGMPGTQWFYRPMVYAIPGSWIGFDNPTTYWVGEFRHRRGETTTWHSCRQFGFALYDCPERTAAIGSRPAFWWDVWPDYGLNGFYGLGPEKTNLWTIGSPSQSVLLAEKDGLNWHVTPDYFSPIPSDPNPPSGRHNGRTNVLWADLHAAPHDRDRLGNLTWLWDRE